MLIAINAQPEGHRAIFPVPSSLQKQFKITFDGYIYSPSNPEEVATVASHMLDFAIERYLYHSYDSFVLTVLTDYPQFQLEGFSPLDSAMCTAYSEGFLHQTFADLLAVIRQLHQTHLDYTDERLLSLLQTLYDWSNIHAEQFESATSEVFTRNFTRHATSPVYAFLAICDELDLPLLKWVEHEPKVFRDAFGYDFTTFTANPTTSETAPKAKTSKSMLLPALDPVLLESGVA